MLPPAFPRSRPFRTAGACYVLAALPCFAALEFEPGRSISAHASRPLEIVAADLDGDGDQDLVTRAEMTPTVNWYENTGQGQMVLRGEREDVDEADERTIVRDLCDFDGDGFPDVLLEMRRGAGAQEVFKSRIVYGAGLAGFGPRTTELGSLPGNEFASYLAQDVDGNGLPDLISGTNTILNPGGPSPVTVATSLVNDPVTYYDGVRWIDWNGDGRLDPYLPEWLMWWENLGGGVISTSRTINPGPAGDGAVWMEMIRDASLPGGRGLLVHTQAGDGGKLKLLVEDGAAWVEVGKAPLNGVVSEILATGAPGSFMASGYWGTTTHRHGVMKISMSFRNGKAKLTVKPVIKDVPLGIAAMALADLDAVAGQELLVSAGNNEGAGGDQLVYYPAKGGGFLPKPVAISVPAAMETLEQLVDFDGDGDLDLITTCYDQRASQGQAAWYENTGNAQSFTRRVILTRGATLRVADAVDLNGDGKMELLTAVYTGIKNSTNYRCEIMLSAAVGTAGKRKLTPILKRDVADTGGNLETGDWDKDGLIDIVFWEGPSGQVEQYYLQSRWFKGFPQMRFAPFGMSLGNGAAETLYDADGDGDLDLVPLYSFNHVTEWRENTGLAAAPTAHPVPDGLDFFSVTTAALADLDGNGWMDYILDGQPILAFPDGNFQTLTTFPMGKSWFHDLDGDGDADAVLRSRGSNPYSNAFGLRWLENLGDAEFAESSTLQEPITGFWNNVLAGDLDGDGVTDVLAERDGDLGRIEWFRGSLIETP
jgi:hypothetical protein